MPSRILREGILDSEAVNALSFAAEVFYRRLMSVVDDFGRFDGRPSVIRARLYSLQLDRVTESDVRGWLAECERVGLVSVYVVGGKPFVLFGKLGIPRAKDSRFPAPLVPTVPQLASVNGCAQTRADVPYSYSDSDSYSGSDSISCSEPGFPASEPKHDEPPVPPTSRDIEPATSAEPPVMSLPCVGTGAKEWHLTPAKLAEWVAAFPGIDVHAECRKARQWLLDNPKRGKTAAGMSRYLGSWLGRAQERAPSGHSSPARAGSFDRGAQTESRIMAQIREALAPD